MQLRVDWARMATVVVLLLVMVVAVAVVVVAVVDRKQTKRTGEMLRTVCSKHRRE